MNWEEELDRIPMPAKVLAAVLFCVITLLMSKILGDWAGMGMLLGAVMGSFLAGWILISGYVYADAGRRGMSAAGWTAVVVLVPNGLGFLLYFLLRKPLARPCPRCGNPVHQGAAFCPSCGQQQLAA